MASILRPEELDSIQLRLKQQPEPPRRARMDLADLAGASGVFLLVFLSTFPVALPFIFMHNSLFALRVSNAIAVALLFFVGVGYGRCVGRSPWGIGVSMVVVGVSLVALTMALGG